MKRYIKKGNFRGQLSISVMMGVIVLSLVFTSCKKGTGSSGNYSSDGIDPNISVENFNKLQVGMSYEEVCDILGKEGIKSSSETAEMMGEVVEHTYYHWKRTETGLINCLFSDNKLVAKSQFGLDDEEVNTSEEKVATLDKYESLSEGMTYEEVVNIMGDRGSRVVSGELEVGSNTVEQALYVWKGENFSSITVTFEDNRLTSKTQQGLR